MRCHFQMLLAVEQLFTHPIKNGKTQHSQKKNLRIFTSNYFERTFKEEACEKKTSSRSELKIDIFRRV